MSAADDDDPGLADALGDELIDQLEGDAPGAGAGVDRDSTPAGLAPVVFGYFPGFAAGVEAGYREGRRDLERAKSDAASDGYRRGLATVEQFYSPPPSSAGWLLPVLLGFAFGWWLEGRRAARAAAAPLEEEGMGDDVPELRG